jgi:hypothetical protein
VDQLTQIQDLILSLQSNVNWLTCLIPISLAGLVFMILTLQEMRGMLKRLNTQMDVLIRLAEEQEKLRQERERLPEHSPFPIDRERT